MLNWVCLIFVMKSTYIFMIMQHYVFTFLYFWSIKFECFSYNKITDHRHYEVRNLLFILVLVSHVSSLCAFAVCRQRNTFDPL